MYLARSRQYTWLANPLHNITVLRTFFVHCESKMLGLCLNTLKSIAGTSILWPCNLPYFRNPIWYNDKFSSSITSAMTAQRNMYCLAYATNFFTQKQLPSGNSSQPYCLSLSTLKDQKPTMVNAQSHGLGVISSHSVGFEQSWSTWSPGLLSMSRWLYDWALGTNSYMTSY